MAYEKKNNEVYMFRNQPREGEALNPKAPNYKGKGLVDGVVKDFAMWMNKEKKYFHIKIQDEYVKKENVPAPQKDGIEQTGDGLPF